MAARVHNRVAWVVISLFVAVISLPMTAAAVSMPTWARALGGYGSELRSPMRIATAADGSFYVSDPRNSAVLKYSPAGVLQQRIKMANAGEIPQSVAILPDGNLVVTLWKSSGSSAAIIDAVSGIEKSRLSGYAFTSIDGVTADSDTIYVVDPKALKVIKFGLDGVKTGEFSAATKVNSADASVPFITMPKFIAYEKVSGLLAVVDEKATAADGGTVRFYDKAGAPVKSFGAGSAAAASLAFSAPQSIAFQYNAAGTALTRMYVVDTYNSTVQAIIPSGMISGTTTFSSAGFIGDSGLDAAAGALYLPAGAAFDQKNKRLIVANGNGNVVMYGVDGGYTPTTSLIKPVITWTAPNMIQSSIPLIISGTVTKGSSVSCLNNGQVVASWTSNGTNTNWSCTYNTLSSDNAISVIARNTSPTTAELNASVKYIASAANVNINAYPYYVNTSTLSLSGTTDATSIQVCNNGINCVDSTPTAGNWSISGLALTQGNNSNITLKTTKGAVDATITLHNVVYGLTSLDLKVSAVSSGAKVTDQIQNITGIVQGATGMLEGVYLNVYNDAGTTILETRKATVLKNGTFSIPMVGVTAYNVVAKDLAGAEVKVPATGVRTISYDPNLIKVSVISQVNDGSVVGSASQTLSGTIDTTKDLASYSMTVNGSAATLDKQAKTWTANVTLSSNNYGLNDIQIIGSDTATTKVSLIYDQTNPAVSFAAPTADLATKNEKTNLTGKKDAGVTLTATLLGSTVEVASLASFEVTLLEEGIYPVVLTADTGTLQSQVARNILYDITPPVVSLPPSSCVSIGNCPSSASFTGTIEAGAKVNVYTGSNIELETVVYSNAGKTWTVGTASRDPYDTVIVVTDGAGNTRRVSQGRPDGNILIDTTFASTDLDHCMSKVANYGPYVSVGPNLTSQELSHGDVGPVVDGSMDPDGQIDLIDCILIQRKLNGMTVPF